MKKLIASILTVALLMATMVVALPTTVSAAAGTSVTYGKGSLSLTEIANLNSETHTSNDAGWGDARLSGGGVLFTSTGNTLVSADGFGAAELPGADLSTAKYIVLDVVNKEATKMEFTPLFKDQSGGTATVSCGLTDANPVYLLSDAGVRSKALISKTFTGNFKRANVIIPGNFSGYVLIPRAALGADCTTTTAATFTGFKSFGVFAVGSAKNTPLLLVDAVYTAGDLPTYNNNTSAAYGTATIPLTVAADLDNETVAGSNTVGEALPTAGGILFSLTDNGHAHHGWFGATELPDVNLSSAKYLAFAVTNKQSGVISFYPEFHDPSDGMIVLSSELEKSNPVYLVDRQGTRTEPDLVVSSSRPNVSIPAGFSGYVLIPTAAFSNNYTGTQSVITSTTTLKDFAVYATGTKATTKVALMQLDGIYTTGALPTYTAPTTGGGGTTDPGTGGGTTTDPGTGGGTTTDPGTGGTETLQPAPNGMLYLVNETFDSAAVNATGQSVLGGKFTLSGGTSDSYVKVIDDPASGKMLQSHLFAEAYITKPLTDGYVFSLDVTSADGSYHHGVFTRSARPASGGFYEAEAGVSATNNAHNPTGISFHAVNVSSVKYLRVVIRYFDATADTKCATKVVDIPLTASGNVFKDIKNLQIVDNNSKMEVYLDSTLMCTIQMSNPGKTYTINGCQFADAFFGQVTLTRADNGQQTTVNNTLVTSAGAIIGWTTRAVNMSVDNVRVMIPTTGGSVTPDIDENANPGGSTSGGNTSGGNTSGGNTSGGNTSGGNTSGSNTSGGNTSGGNTSGGNTSGGNTSGDNTSGDNTSGGNTSGGNTSGGNTSGDNTSGGNTSGGNTSGDNTSGGNTPGDSTGDRNTGDANADETQPDGEGDTTSAETVYAPFAEEETRPLRTRGCQGSVMGAVAILPLVGAALLLGARKRSRDEE